MLSVTGINRFYYLRGFTDMRCKHSRVLSVIREQLHREPSDGDIYIVMSKDRRIVRLFAYDNRSYSLFEKKFVAGYQFMRIIKDDEGNEVAYRIDWKDVVLLLENPVIKSLKMSNEPETAKGSLYIFSHKYLFHRSVQPNLPVFSNNVLLSSRQTKKRNYKWNRFFLLPLLRSRGRF